MTHSAQSRDTPADPAEHSDRLSGQHAAGGGDSARRAAIAEEQQYLDQMYNRLTEMFSDAARRKDDARFSSDGTPAGRFNRDALQFRYSQEMSAINAAEDKLCFGRLDREQPLAESDTDGQQAAEASIHIGRIGLTDGTSERRQILIDWRAPASAPFYTATALNPQGVIRRRHLQTRRKMVQAVADEYLQSDSTGDSIDTVDSLGAAGNSALLAALNAPRTGRMHDIIATIQSEQDNIIRSDRAGVLVVQGGPGTGKTVVALHRAAYLLYTHRERLGSHGVLVIGPNTTFLEYIGQVLPSLGESSVVLATVGTLFPGVTAVTADPPEAAEIKGRPMMIKVIDNAVLDRQRMPKRHRTFVYDRGRVRLEPSLLNRAQRQAWGSRLPHNRARQIFLRVVLDGLSRQIAGRPGVKQGPEQETEAASADIAAIRKEMGSDPAVVQALADLWPPLTAQQLVSDLFSDERRLRFAAPSLSAAQRNVLVRGVSAPWTAGDVPLLDEAAELLGDIGTADLAWSKQRKQDLEYAQQALDALGEASDDQQDSGINFTVGMLSAEDLADLHTEDRLAFTISDRAAADREWTYGHVIIDEAQELSSMGWRMVMRRCPVKSMTVVGDIAQTSDPAGAQNWARALRPHVGDRWRMAELTVNYRTPGEIMDVAVGVLDRIDRRLSIPTSLRRSGSRPWARRSSADKLGAEVARAALEEAASNEQGQLAVLVPDGRQPEFLAAVRAAVPEASADAGPGRRVVVLTVREAKGLEFDAVLVVEPAEIVGQSTRGWGDLYVGLTRSTQRLGVLHAQDLPDGLRIPDAQSLPTPSH